MINKISKFWWKAVRVVFGVVFLIVFLPATLVTFLLLFTLAAWVALTGHILSGFIAVSEWLVEKTTPEDSAKVNEMGRKLKETYSKFQNFQNFEKF